MIAVLFNWLYILLVTGMMGSVILYLFYRKGKYRFLNFTACFFAGLAAVTVYAQIFSIFGGVGAAANLLLLAACVLLHAFFGKGIRRMFAETMKKPSKWEVLILLLLVLIFAYGTSEGYMMYDSDLYHAQSIRWVEEFGAVRGLGNLQSRLAYNSAAFSLTALFSMKFLFGQSLHCVSGLMALFVFADSLKFLKLFRRKAVRVSDFARVGAIYYIALIYKEMMSPASDYFTILTLFYIFIRWLDLLEEKETEATPYALLCVLGVFAVTLKISAALVLLLVLKPAVMLLREKRFPEILMYLGLGLAAAAPYFIRNVILSGWLVYPYTSIDLFAFDWKMPVFMARYDAQEIQVWARGIYDVAAYHTPTLVWMKSWFAKELSGMEKLLVLSSVGAILCQVLYGILLFIRSLRGKTKAAWDWLHVTAVVDVCFLFWLFSAPMIRYGYAYPLLVPLITAGIILCRLQKDRQKVWLGGAIFLCLISLYRFARMGQEGLQVLQSFGIHGMQQDYGEYEAEAVRLGNEDGYTVYIPTEGDRIGYSHFPSTRKPEEVLPGGSELKDGFLYHYR